MRVQGDQQSTNATA